MKRWLIYVIEKKKPKNKYTHRFYLAVSIGLINFQVATWEQMYREWMATMERRVNNLQVTNEELQVKISSRE